MLGNHGDGRRPTGTRSCVASSSSRTGSDLQAFVAAERAAHVVYPPRDRGVRRAPPHAVRRHQGGDPRPGSVPRPEPGPRAVLLRPPRRADPAVAGQHPQGAGDRPRRARSRRMGTSRQWARQGVLLLNTTLTVRAGQAASHQGKGWETFTDQVIRTVSDKPEHVVFILWGSQARRKKRPLIDSDPAHDHRVGAPVAAVGAQRVLRQPSRSAAPTRRCVDRRAQTPIDWEPRRSALMAWTTSDRVMALRRRSAVVDVVVDMLDGWRRHQSGRNASLLSFFFFLSIFPLLLVATTILGFVLQDNEDLQQRIVGGALDEHPGARPAAGRRPDVARRQRVGADRRSADRAVVGDEGVRRFAGGAGRHLGDRHRRPRAAMHVQRGRAVLGLVIVGVAQIGSLALTAIVERGRPARLQPDPAPARRPRREHRRDRLHVPVPHRRLAHVARRVARRRRCRHRVQPAAVLRLGHRQADHRQRRRHVRPVRPGARPGHLARLPRHLRPDEPPNCNAALVRRRRPSSIAIVRVEETNVTST